MANYEGVESSARLARASHGLTDDVLTLLPRARSMRAYLSQGADQMAGADPGLTQLRLAIEGVLSIGVGVGLAYLFVKLTGALRLPASAGTTAAVHTADHSLMIVALLITAIVALLTGSAITDTTARGQVISTLILPIPMLATITIGLTLSPYRLVSLIWLVILLAVCVYVRRWGPRGVAAGLIMFQGGFLGFFLHTNIGLDDLGWIAALLFIGVIASLLVRFTLFRPNRIRTLNRMRRSWEARAGRLLTLSLALMETDNAGDRQHRAKHLQRQAVRLNECTLMIDAQLAESVPESADIEARRLFDADLSLSNISRFADALAEQCNDDELRGPAIASIDAVLSGNADIVDRRATILRHATSDDERMTVVAHRLADATGNYMTARRQLEAEIERRRDTEQAEFTPAVTLNAGWLPGSSPVSTEASTTPGRFGVLDRTALPPYARATIQVAIAATIAIFIGDMVSQQRLYWAVVATFLAFIATTNSAEQVRKALFRVGGTAIGIIIGDLLVHVTGGHIWSSLLIVMAALFFGIYLVRVNYTFMVIGTTVTLSQLYAQLGEFSWHLLLLRFEETAIGVGAVVLTVLLVVPLRPQRVLATGVLLWFRSLSALINRALDQMLGTEGTTLRAEIRDLDAAYAALEATATPLRSGTFGRNSTQLTEIRAVSSAARNYARGFAVGVQNTHMTDSRELDAAATQLRASMAAIDKRIETGEHGTYTKAAGLIEIASRTAPDGGSAQLLLRDLRKFDSVLSRLANALQMTVVDHYTVPDPELEPEAEPART